MSSDQVTLLLMEMLYNLWLATLVISFSASIILFHNYLRSRKTPIGRNALFTSISSLIWSISISIYTYPEIEHLQYDLGFFFLTIGFLAGIFTMLAAYERHKIQTILTPGGKGKYEWRPLLVLAILTLAVVILAVLTPLINSSYLNSRFDGMSMLSALSLILLCGSLIAFTRPEFPRKLIFLFASIPFIIAFAVIFWYYFVDYSSPFDASFIGGGTTLETAKGILIASLGVFLAFQRGLKAWFVKIMMATGIMFIVILDVVAYFGGQPVFFPDSVALCFIFISLAQFWHTLRTG